MQNSRHSKRVLLMLGIAGFLGSGCAASASQSQAPTHQMTSAEQTAETRARYQRAANSAEFRCLALNLYWEARGEGERGMQAVGWVVLNRVASPEFPSSICGVVHEGGESPPCQFSWWCDGRSDYPREPNSWRAAQAISADLLRSPPADPTRGALFFHSTAIRSPWLRKRERTAQIGRHIFYR